MQLTLIYASAGTPPYRSVERSETNVRYKEMVPLAGVEPAHLSVLDFESSASTNSTTEAHYISC